MRSSSAVFWAVAPLLSGAWFASALPQPAVSTTTAGSSTIQIVVDATSTSSLIKPSYNSKLDTQGVRTGLPAPSFTSLPASAAKATPSVLRTSNQLAKQNTTIHAASDIFAAISTDEPPTVFPRNGSHPVKKIGVIGDGPVETNRFYASLFITDSAFGRSGPVWTLPYVVKWTDGHTNTGDVGFTLSHSDASARVYGPNATSIPVEYYLTPSNLEDITMGATELVAGEYTTAIDSPAAFSVNQNIIKVDSTDNSSVIKFPLCQGQAMLTGLYDGALPQITTGSGVFSNLTSISLNRDGITKFRISVTNGVTWLAYAVETAAGDYTTPVTASSFDLSIVNNTRIAPANGTTFHGILQLAKLPINATAEQEALYDAAAGGYCTGVDLSGSVSDSGATYSFGFQKGGVGTQDLLMYALPHHVASITNLQPTGLQLLSGTKGMMTAFVGNTWTMAETDLATDVSWAPWSRQGAAAAPTYSTAVMQKIADAAAVDVAYDFDAKADLDSMYWSGKELSKDAFVCWTVSEVLKDANMTSTCLGKLKTAFARFSSNQQINQLYYDTVWGGLVSSASYKTDDSGLDYGNTYYNDHHFHYGYHVHAAAVIAHLDPTWATDANKAYVNALIRDFANPSSDDPYFPVQRSFDWFAGHSWAKGLFVAGDGKDQESGSEDYFATYGMLQWARATGDANMEARATLMLAVQERSLNTYFMLHKGNEIHPAQFEPNMVSGIMFEGKVDCVTYFGTDPSLIHGIQMIPISPVSAYIRNTTFVQDEWDSFFADTWSDLEWSMLLKANQALIDPSTSYDYFAGDDVDLAALDSGASLTWYLAWTAGLQSLAGTATS